MKYFLVLLFLNFSTSAFVLKSSWNKENKKELTMQCFAHEYLCDQVCGERKCTVPEKTCHNCIGTSLHMTFLFQEMGRMIVNTKEKLDSYSFSDFIKSNAFVSLTAKSIYNLIHKFDSKELKAKFQSLCPDETPYPVVFFKRDSLNELSEPQAVWCYSGVFKIERIY